MASFQASLFDTPPPHLTSDMDLMAARRVQEEQLLKPAAQIQDNNCSQIEWGVVAAETRKQEEEEVEEEEEGEMKERWSSSSSSSSKDARKEHMFDKVVTPSDVGKLNRLVIPKQHAEKYFPLDSSANEKGLLLNFEDRGGKPWRFRYSYWNSSQSYVMTKGWSRFVKEKKLDPGDTVSFHRGVGEIFKGHLYIDWRRRRDAALIFPPHLHPSLPWVPLLRHPPPFYSHQGLLLSDHHHHLQLASSAYYLRPRQPVQVGGGGGGSSSRPLGIEQLVVAKPAAPVAPKRLRLFGVDVECPSSDECGASHSEQPSSFSFPILLNQKGKTTFSSSSLDLEI